MKGLERPDPISGVSGPGRWLILEYEPVALFSLKSSMATSSVGKTLLVPTPYAIKMAFVDAAFRARWSWEECDQLLRSLVSVEVRIGPPEAAIVTHTFVKVRQEPKKAQRLRPYIANIAYREFVYHCGSWRWAFDLAVADGTLAHRLVCLAPMLNYIGKRGSFIQFRGISWRAELGLEFTQPVQTRHNWILPARYHIALLDDFGPQANLGTLSSFTPRKPRRDQHRRFVETIVPLGLVNSGPGFSEYRR